MGGLRPRRRGRADLSALTGDGVAALERAIAERLPLGPALFPADMVTDRSPQFIAQEIIREQLYHQLGKELPYACAVQIETWTEKSASELAIGAVIVVERDSQKAIVVGRGGARIRELGIAARHAVGEALGKTGAPVAVRQGDRRVEPRRGRAAPRWATPARTAA